MRVIDSLYYFLKDTCKIESDFSAKICIYFNMILWFAIGAVIADVSAKFVNPADVLNYILAISAAFGLTGGYIGGYIRIINCI